MLVSLTVGKVDAGVTVLLTEDKRLIEFPSILLPQSISSGSIVDITVARNSASERSTEAGFRSLQDKIYSCFGADQPATPVLRCLNATQTSVVLEWDTIQLATADLISLALYRNGQKAGNIPRPLQMHSTKISGLAVDTEYTFHLVLRTTAGTMTSEKVTVQTHKMTDLSGVTITAGILPAALREKLSETVARIGAKMVDSVRIDTTHFVTTEGRGIAWEKAVENNIPVVRPEWVEACEKSGRILGVTKFYLDAMRPVPLEQSAHQEAPAPSAPPGPSSPPPPPPPDKDEANPVQSTEPTEQAEHTKQGGLAHQGSADGTESTFESDDEASAKPSEASPQDEQKVRIEDKEQQKVALRPGSSRRQPDAQSGVHDDGQSSGEAGHESDEERHKKKAEASPDASSFQEVEL